MIPASDGRPSLLEESYWSQTVYLKQLFQQRNDLRDVLHSLEQEKDALQ